MKNAKYIWINNDSTYQTNQFVLFRKSQNIDFDKVQDMIVNIYADSRYALYVNGIMIGRGPAPSDPKHAVYDSYNVEKYLNDGENIIAVAVCYYGNQTCDCIQGSPELILRTDITYHDGLVETVATDHSWKCLVPLCWPIGGSRRSIWKSVIEIFDSREYPEGWNCPGYDDGLWMNATELDEAPHHQVAGLKPRDIQYLCYNKISCKKAYRSGQAEFSQDPAVVFKNKIRSCIKELTDTSYSDSFDLPISVYPHHFLQYYIFDFERDVVGRIGFRIKAQAGTTIDIVFRETEEKSVTQLSVSSMLNWKRYICHDGEQEWLSFEVEGFRFLQLAFQESKSPIEILEVFIEEQRYPSECKGVFECSDIRLNRLWKTGADTIRLCMQDLYTDNPVREMAPWSGDIEYAKLVSYYVTGDYELAARGLKQMSYGQEKSGRMPPLWPSGLPFSVSARRCLEPTGFELPHHTLQWISSVWRHYMYSGDKDLMEELFSNAVNACRWFAGKCGEDGLLYNNEKWEDRWDWLDWEGQKNIWASLNLFYYGALSDLRNMAEELKDEEIVKKTNKSMQKLKSSFKKKYWSDEYKAFVDCYTETNGNREPFFSEITLSLALKYGFVPKTYENEVLIRMSGELPDCSPVHKYHPYIAYSMNGMYEKVLKEFRTKWINMWSVEGTGTFQEVWEFNPDSGNSCCCQSASAVPAFYLPAYILGIRPTKPGFEEFIVDPVPVDLEWTRGAVHMLHGSIKVEWVKRGNIFDIEIEVPEGYRMVKSKKKRNGMVQRIYKRNRVHG